MSNQKIITAGTILDGDKLEVRENWAILVDDGTIVETGPAAALCGKYNTVTVDRYDECCIIPGLIDCHVHLVLNCNVPDYLGRLAMPEAEMAYTTAKNLGIDLKSGVTYARCMGDRFHLDILTKRLISEGALEGPRLKACGLGLRSSAGHGYNGIPCDGIDEITKVVRSNISKGADWIKFYVTGMWPDRGLIQCFYTKKEIERMIDVAHRAGVPVTSHNIGGQALVDCVNAGIDCLEHLYFATDDDIDLMLKHGTWACLTASEYFTEKPFMAGWYRDKLLPGRTTATTCLSHIIASGIPYVLGTDGMHGDLYMEMKYAVDFGASTIGALQAGTINAAKLLKIDGERGSITPAKQADLCVVSGDPVREICDMKKVTAVYQAGVLK